MPGTLTAANATILFTVVPIFPVPVQLQGFATDDIFSTEQQSSAETLMGVDGRLSAGFVYAPIVQNFTMQADSDSNDFFEQWNAAQKTAKDLYFANGIVLIPGLGRKWAMTRGVLTSFPPIPDAGKILKPRRFTLTWENVSPAAA